MSSMNGNCGQAESVLIAEATNVSFRLRFTLNETSKQYKMQMWISKNITEGEFEGAGKRLLIDKLIKIPNNY